MSNTDYTPEVYYSPFIVLGGIHQTKTPFPSDRRGVFYKKLINYKRVT